MGVWVVFVIVWFVGLGGGLTDICWVCFMGLYLDTCVWAGGLLVVCFVVGWVVWWVWFGCGASVGLSCYGWFGFGCYLRFW